MFRLTVLFVLTCLAAVASAGPALLPYQGDDHWLQMPSGRTLGAPSGLALDPDGESLWVFERCGGDSCSQSSLAPILKFDGTGKPVSAFGEGLFVFPHGMAVDRAGNVYVTDAKGDGRRGHQVFKFSPDGKLLLTLGKAGVAGETADTFNMPAAVAIAANGDIFVADGHLPLETNMRIMKFSPDGKLIKSWGSRGAGEGQLNDPHALAFDSQGRLFVADRGNRRIQVFDQEGKFIAAWPQFGTPSGLFIAADDTLYVADTKAGIYIGNARDGSVRAFVRPAATPAPADIRLAESIVVDRRGHIFAGENAHFRLLKIELPAH
jgi:sugar lactone lactonase YvrE